MPQISEFNSPVDSLRPSEVGVEATAAAARREGQFFNQVAGATQAFGERAGHELGSSIAAAGDQAVQYLQHREISHGAAAYAGMLDGLTKAWNDAASNANKSDPNDPTVAATFREQTLEPALDKFREGFNTEGGQQWAEARIDELRNHFFQKTSADMSTLAGNAARVNVATLFNGLSNTALRDPSSVPHLLDTIDASVGGIVDSSPNLTAVQRSNLKSELAEKGREAVVKSGVLGAMQTANDPEAIAADWGKRYPQYINGAELNTLGKTAAYFKRLAQSEFRAQRAMQDYETKKDFNGKIDALEASTMPQKAGDPPQLPKTYWDDLRTLSQHPGAALEPGRLAAMVTKGEAITARLNKGEPLGPISHDTTMTLLKQIRGDEGQPRMVDNGPIYKEYEAGHLKNADFNFLLNEFNNIRTPEGQQLAAAKKNFLKAIEPQIDKSMPGANFLDVDGKERFYQFSMELDRRMAQYRAQGKDPFTLLDPKSPDYMGNPQALQQFKSPLAQQLSHAIRSAGGVGSALNQPAVVEPKQIASQFKNFFSSGRAAQSGITFNPATDLTKITVGEQTAEVNKYAAPHFQAFLDDLAREGYRVDSLGGYADRDKRGGTSKSEHAFGNAIDLNPDRNAQHSGKTDLPANVGYLAAKHGLIWGGNWQGSSNDPMHFEWAGVPEMGNLQPSFRAPPNWQFSTKLQRYRDPASGKQYDLAGNEISKGAAPSVPMSR